MILAEKPRIEPHFQGDWRDWDGLNWIFIDNWVGWYDFGNYNFVMDIKRGWVTDFGSIPSWYRFRINQMGRGIVGFIPHDGGYSTGFPLTTIENARYDWDQVLAHSLEWIGFGFSRRTACYTAVRVGGSSSWNKYTEETVANANEFVKITLMN